MMDTGESCDVIVVGAGISGECVSLTHEPSHEKMDLYIVQFVMSKNACAASKWISIFGHYGLYFTVQ